jgi:hypothetical protein
MSCPLVLAPEGAGCASSRPPALSPLGGRSPFARMRASTSLTSWRFTFVPFGTGHAGSDLIGSPERPVLMEYVDDEATQKRKVDVRAFSILTSSSR